MLADQPVGGGDVSGPPDLQSYWTYVETVNNEREQHAGLVERGLRQE